MPSDKFVFSPLLDQAFLETLYEDDLGYAADVFSSFLALLPGNLQQLQAAFDAGDLAQFRKLVHQHKPAFSYVGLTQLTQQMEALEKKCDAVQQIQEAGSLYQTVLTQVTQFQPVLEEELTRLQTQLVKP